MTRILVFGAPWCGPCSQLKQTLEDEGLLDKVEYKNAEDHQDLANKYEVRSVPTTVILNEDEVVGHVMGNGPDVVETIAEYV